MTKPNPTTHTNHPDETEPLDALRALFAEFRKLDEAAPLDRHVARVVGRRFDLMRQAAELFAAWDREERRIESLWRPWKQRNGYRRDLADDSFVDVTVDHYRRWLWRHCDKRGVEITGSGYVATAADAIASANHYIATIAPAKWERIGLGSRACGRDLGDGTWLKVDRGGADDRWYWSRHGQTESGTVNETWTGFKTVEAAKAAADEATR